MKRFIFFGISAFIVSAILIACGENKSTNTPAVNPYATNNGCPTGTVYTNGFCYNGSGANWNGYLNGYSSSTNFITDNFTYRNFSVEDSDAYRNFIKKAMGTCDRQSNSGGVFDCDSWVGGQFQLIIQVPTAQSNTMKATFAAYPSTNNYYWYGYSLPSAKEFFYGMFGFPVYYDVGVVKNPLPLEMTVSLINNSKGWEARAYGDEWTAANRSLIQIQVLEGKLTDASFEYQLAFEGQIFATGTFQKYK